MDYKKTLRVVVPEADGLYREKRILATLDSVGAEVNRSEEFGAAFRLAGVGEQATVRLLNEDTYEVLRLVKVGISAPTTTSGRPRRIKEPKKRSSSGQCGPPIVDLDFNGLNLKERRLVEVLLVRTKPTKILDLAYLCWPNEPKVRRSSWVRNSLRRLVRAQFVARVSDGLYKITATGRKYVREAA
jgi:hypothetical protein